MADHQPFACRRFLPGRPHRHAMGRSGLHDSPTSPARPTTGHTRERTNPMPVPMKKVSSALLPRALQGGGAVVCSMNFSVRRCFLWRPPPPAKAKLLGLVTAGLASAFALTAPSHAVTLQSGFAGDYAPANWTTTVVYGDGSVDTTGAPGSITLTGGSIGVFGGDTTYTANATAAGQVSFSWDYSRAFSGFSIFRYIINSNGTLITSGYGATTGITSFNVAVGDIFGFGVGNSGSVPFGLATVTISNFSAPIPSSAPATSSVPGPLPILGLAAAFGFSRKLRKRIKLHRGTSAVSTSPSA